MPCVQVWKGATLPQYDTPIRVLIVDDYALVCECLPPYLASLVDDITVVGTAGSSIEAIHAIRELRPHVVLLGLTLPDGSGLEIAQHVHDTQPTVKIVSFTEHDDEATLQRLHHLDVLGYLKKREAVYRIVAAIRAVAAGQTFWPPSAAPASVAHSGIVLTEREEQVLARLATGQHNNEIAAALHLTSATVEYHVHHLFLKLDAHTRVEVVNKAREQGLL